MFFTGTLQRASVRRATPTLVETRTNPETSTPDESALLRSRDRDHRPHHARVCRDPDAGSGRVRGRAAAQVRRSPREATRAPRPAAGGARRRQTAGLPPRDAWDPRGRLDVRAVSGRSRRSACRDHRSRRPEDDRQRAQFRCKRFHGRLRGREHAEVGQQPPGPSESARRDPPAGSSSPRPRASSIG